MAKIQVVEPKTRKAIKPQGRIRITALVVQIVQLLLQGLVVYLLLK